MRASTASIILAFCAMVAVQAAPVSTDSALVARGTHDFEYNADGTEMEERGTHDFEYNADGTELEERGTHDFQYDDAGDEVEKREPKKKAKKAKKAKRDSDFEYDAEGNELADDEEVEKRDFSYNAAGEEVDASGNVIDKREPKKKAKKAKKAKRDSDFEYDAEGNELLDDEE